MSRDHTAEVASGAAEWALLRECCTPRASASRLRHLLQRGVNWNSLMDQAFRHGVLAHLAVKLKDAQLPEAARRVLHDRHRAQVVHTLRLSAELFQITAMLKDAGLEIPVVKGPVLSARAYGDPGRRPYGDLDFLARQKEIKQITCLMQSAGYEPAVPPAAIKKDRIPGQYLFLRPQTRSVVEFHTERTLRYFPKALPIEEFYERKTRVKIDQHEVPALAMEDEFVLICVHGAKHFWERLMWIADVAALAAQEQTINWARVSKTAESVAAGRMVRAGIFLAAKILRAPVSKEMEQTIAGDRGLPRIRDTVEQWLPAAGGETPGVLKRAAFRMAMRGGGLARAKYFLRLLFSPTEEDWKPELSASGSRWGEVLGRPLRLAKKYRRGRN